MNLFAAYREVPDKQFKGYVQPIQDQHYDAWQPQNPNRLTLMTTIENYYKGMVKDSIWMKPDADQETIIALKAQIETRQQRKTGKIPQGRKDWRLTPPKAGESMKKVITINRKQLIFYWCPKHKRWTIHQPKDCRLNLDQPQPELKTTDASTPAKDKKKINKNQGLVLRVMNAIFDSNDDNESANYESDNASSASSEQQSDVE
jgi:hypothetical protein